MEIREAVSIINEQINCGTFHTKTFEAFLMGINALKRLEPMKMPGTHTNYRCAVCGRRIRSGKGSSSFTRDNFCQKCGQAIDWSEDGET